MGSVYMEGILGFFVGLSVAGLCTHKERVRNPGIRSGEVHSDRPFKEIIFSAVSRSAKDIAALIEAAESVWCANTGEKGIFAMFLTFPGVFFNTF